MSDFYDEHKLSKVYRTAHNLMRNIDGLQSQEAFDELLKYLFFKQTSESLMQKISIPFKLRSNGSFSKDDSLAVAGIREMFTDYISRINSWSEELWADKCIHLSDRALWALHELMQDIEFNSISLDIRSAALKEFLPSEIRKGLGIYLTPDDVVRAMVHFVKPNQDSKVYDPAVGSGTFLIETYLYWMTSSSNHRKATLWGSDKNPRMLLLADLNLQHLDNVHFNRRLADALVTQSRTREIGDWPMPNTFDYIFTNPPFGITLDSNAYDLTGFSTCKDNDGSHMSKQNSEVVFIEQSLRYLKPGGTLAIVLPRSIVTNVSLSSARMALSEFGYVYAIITLPSETFQITGTQTTTVVLFVKKYMQGEDRAQNINVCLASVSNVGYDSTGRFRENSQLPMLAENMRMTIDTNQAFECCQLLDSIEKSDSFNLLPEMLSGLSMHYSGKRLSDAVAYASTGSTPRREDYSDSGLFLIKVGNLTGNGISWLSRDRNYIDGDAAQKRRTKSSTMLVKPGDILLTSSAHNTSYISKKVDVVYNIPDWVGGEASYVGEVMLLRVLPYINPYILVAYLRQPEVRDSIQKLVRGQTAHLHPKDLLSLEVSETLFSPDSRLQRLAELIKRESELSKEFNDLAYIQDSILNL